MKKVFSLLVICLLLTSCGSKKDENNQQNNQGQQNSSEQSQTSTTGLSIVKKVSDETTIYTYDTGISYNGANVKDSLANDTLTVDTIIEGMSFTTQENDASNMYIIEQEPAFYVMVCNSQSNKNIYISKDFDEAEQSCK